MATSSVENSQKPAGKSSEISSTKAAYESFSDVKKMLPIIRNYDYYTDPRIHELAVKERTEPGFCSHVQDFVVGQHRFGSVKFSGQTDVQRLDVEAIVQFNSQQVRVYMDKAAPPKGQGLNKPAEVTLFDCKCIDKITRSRILKGPRVKEFEKKLKKKAEENSAKFLSYDAETAEWKVTVEHFDKFQLGYDEECDT